jgi:beta-lactamase regulating signal transducer with metallopeptidase domain
VTALAAATDFGGWILRTSWQASVLIALVFVIRRALGRWLQPRWQYALWLLVVARLALPGVPASPTSVFNLVPMSRAPSAAIAVPADRPGSAPSSPASRTLAPVVAKAERAALPWPSVLFGLWALVAAGLLLRIGVRSYRLTSRVCHQRPVTRLDVVDLLEDCKQEMGVFVPINVVQSSMVATPALLGFLRPRLLLPERLLETFDRDALRLLFLHELAHVKRHDILVNWIATFVHVLHWFNPLVAVAMARMRADRELATDSLVLSQQGEEENRAYGETLVRLVEFAARPGVLPGAVGILEDKDELKRRVTMIATHRRNAYGRSALAAALLLTLGVTTLTGSVADSGTATISGVVKDKSGATLKGVSITAIDQGGAKYRATSSDRGAYAMVVPRGRYVLEAEAPGLTALTPAFDVGAGQTTPMDLRLEGPKPSTLNLHWREPKGKKELAADAEALRSGKGANGDAGARLIDDLSAALPDFVWLYSVSRNGNAVLLRGSTNSLGAVADFLANLQARPAFQSVDLVDSYEQDNKFGFEIKAVLAGSQ